MSGDFQLNSPRLPGQLVQRLALILTLGAALAAQAGAPPNAAAAMPRARATNAAPAAVAIPKSVFTLPTNAREGRDPFYPASARFYTQPVTRTQLPPPAVVLELRGISGPPQRRLAIINNRNFAAGEDNEVITANGPTRVHVLEIREDSVVVEVGGERRVLYLAGTKTIR